MIQIVCKSNFLAQGVSNFLHSEFSPNSNHAICIDTSVDSFCNSFKENQTDIVFYESQFFVDPAPFKQINSSCFFVFIASPGEEEKAQKALISGAGAVLYKPFGIEQFQEVLSFAQI